MLTAADLMWIAGFLEGEGAFQSDPRTGQFTVSAAQKQREPLERLHGALGGTLKPYLNKNGTLYYYWRVYGTHAIALSFTLYPVLSPRRREQVRRMVAGWKSRPGRDNRFKTHCPLGHPYDETNTYRYGNRKRRHCRACVFTVYPATRAATDQGA